MPVRSMVLLSCLLTFSTTGAVRADALQDKLTNILSGTTDRGGIAAAMVERVSDGKVLYTQLPDLRLMPGSNRKLFTAAVGLEILGDDWHPKTDVLATATPDNSGAIEGDLILRGGGDPTLSSDELEKIAANLAASGVKSVSGNIVGDGSLFTDGPYPIGWAWDYLSDDYAAQISGLEVNRGVVSVYLNPGSASGDPVTVTLVPGLPFMQIQNSATTTGTSASGAAPVGDDMTIRAPLSFVLPSDAGLEMTKPTNIPPDPPDSLTVERQWDRNTLVVSGTAAARHPAQLDITVADPPLYAATVFLQALADHGITVSGSAVAGKCPKDAVLLIDHPGPSMADYLELMDKPSDNLMAEMLIHMVGVEKGNGGSCDAGIAVETGFLKSLGIDTAPLKFVDGCGVSRRDYITARSACRLLVAMHAKPDWKIYYDSLPIAGVDGTLWRRMKGTPAQGMVHAKTGSLGEVSCLSGYLSGHDGHLYAFSVLMNNYTGPTNDIRHIQDHFVEALIGAL